ncbi:MAG: TonB-dependent receptor, partial [Bacteroidota bacterium]
DNNRVDVLAGYSWQRFVGEGMQTSAQDFLFDQTTFNDLGSTGSPELADFSTFKNANKIISAFTRVNYSLLDRYLVTFTYRTDGSDRFGEENQWGNFPSFALAWRLSEEGFLSGISAMDDLKLRVEYGSIGNSPNSNARGFISATSNLYNDGTGTYISGVELNNLPNEDLRWELTTTTNVGLDFSFLNGRIAGSLDYYNRLTEDLLLSYNVPAPSVFNTVTDNVGTMQNTGFEAAVNLFLIDRGKFTFELAANGAYNQNEIISLSNNIFQIDNFAIQYGELFGAGFVGDNAYQIEEGVPIHSIYTLEWAGFDEAGNELFLDSLGNAVVLDSVANNGNPNRYVGTAVPTFTFSLTPTFRYGNFDLAIYLRGATGFQVVNNTFLQYADPGQLSAGNNVLTAALDVIDEQNIDNSPEFSTRYVESGNFLRLDNLVLGYTLASSKYDWLGRLRVYVAARNLALFTNYSGLDPEVFNTAKASSVDVYGLDFLTYPRSRNITVGLNVTFR